MKTFSIKISEATLKKLKNLLDKTNGSNQLEKFSNLIEMCERESEGASSITQTQTSTPLLSPQNNELELAKKAGIPIEEYKLECQFGTWMKDEKMVYCDCPFPSIVKARPKNHLVPKIVCERCLSRVLTLLNIEAEKERMQFERKGIKIHYPSPERTDLHTQWNETNQPKFSTRIEVYCKKRDYVMDSKKCSEICGDIGWTIRRDQCIEEYKKNSLS